MHNIKVILNLNLIAVLGCSNGARVEPVASVSHHSFVSAVRFSPQRSILASAGNGWNEDRLFSGFSIQDAATLRTIARFPTPKRAQAIAFSPDGATIAVGDGDYQGV